MEYCLKQIESGNPNPLIIHLNVDVKEIGRCTIPELNRFTQLSRKHAVIKKIKNEFFVIDLNSLNGVVVNGAPINPNELIKLSNGDVIFFGAKSFEDPGFKCTFCMVLKPIKKEKIEVIDLCDDNPIDNVSIPSTSKSNVNISSFSSIKTELLIPNGNNEALSTNRTISSQMLSEALHTTLSAVNNKTDTEVKSLSASKSDRNDKTTLKRHPVSSEAHSKAINAIYNPSTSDANISSFKTVESNKNDVTVTSNHSVSPEMLTEALNNSFNDLKTASKINSLNSSVNLKMGPKNHSLSSESHSEIIDNASSTSTSNTNIKVTSSRPKTDILESNKNAEKLTRSRSIRSQIVLEPIDDISSSLMNETSTNSALFSASKLNILKLDGSIKTALKNDSKSSKAFFLSKSKNQASVSNAIDDKTTKSINNKVSNNHVSQIMVNSKKKGHRVNKNATVEILPKQCHVCLIRCDSKYFKWPSDVKRPNKARKRTYSSTSGRHVEEQEYPLSAKASFNNNSENMPKFAKFIKVSSQNPGNIHVENIPGPSNLKNEPLHNNFNTAIVKPMLQNNEEAIIDFNDEDENIGYSQVEEVICISDDDEDSYLDFNSSQPIKQEPPDNDDELDLLDELPDYSSQVEIENNEGLSNYFTDTGIESIESIKKFLHPESVGANNIHGTNEPLFQNNESQEVSPYENMEDISDYVIRCVDNENEHNEEMLSPNVSEDNESDDSSVSLHSILMSPSRERKILKNNKKSSSKNINRMSHLDTIFLANQTASKGKKTNTVGKTLLTEAKPMQQRPRRIRGREEGFIEQTPETETVVPPKVTKKTENSIQSKPINKKVGNKKRPQTRSKKITKNSKVKIPEKVKERLKEIESRKMNKSRNRLNEKKAKKPAPVKKRPENYGSRSLFLSDQPKEINITSKVKNIETKENSVSNNLNSSKTKQSLHTSQKKSSLNLTKKDIPVAKSSNNRSPSVLQPDPRLNKTNVSNFQNSLLNIRPNINPPTYQSATTKFNDIRLTSHNSSIPQHSTIRPFQNYNATSQNCDVKSVQYNNAPSDPRLYSRNYIANQSASKNVSESYLKPHRVSFQLPQENSKLLNMTQNVSYDRRAERNNVQAHHYSTVSHNNSSKPIAVVASTSRSSVSSHPHPEANANLEISFNKMVDKIVSLAVSWITEQKRQKNPPPDVSKGALTLPLYFNSFLSYIASFTPMLMLEIWEEIYKLALPILEDQKVLNKFYFIIHSHENNSGMVKYECESVINKNSPTPTEGTLVVMDLKSKGGKMQFHSVFGYICKHRIVEEFKMNNNSAWGRVEKFWTTGAMLWKFSVFAKIRPLKPVLEDIMKGNVICSIKNKLRQVDALATLSSSPLCKYILKPDRKVFVVSYPKVSRCREYTKSQKRVIEGVTNELQRSASKSKIILLQGPPGTGKTHTIIGLLESLIFSNTNQRKKFLVTAPSNAAIDEIGCRLIELNERSRWRNAGIKFVRVGLDKSMNTRMKLYSLDDKADKIYNETAKDALKYKQQELEKKEKEIKKLREEIMKFPSYQKKKSMEALMSQCQIIKEKMLPMKANYCALRDIKINILKETHVVLSTLGSCCQSILLSVFKSGIADFSCCIVDEATQCTEPEILQPLIFGMNKLILVGDHKQLPATVASQMAMDRHFDRSMFERFYLYFNQSHKENPMFMLKEQFRMHSEICKFPSQFFYEGKLVTVPDNDLRYQSFPILPYIIYDILDSQESNHMLSKTNFNEARSIANICSEILYFDSSVSIGIITPYQAQVKLYRDALSQNPNYRNIEINTVDSFQGREKDVIIVSCVRANSVTGNIGFLSCPKRLNVALTRARQCLIICVHASTVEHYKYWKELISDARQRNRFATVTSSKDISQIFGETMIKKK